MSDRRLRMSPRLSAEEAHVVVSVVVPETVLGAMERRVSPQKSDWVIRGSTGLTPSDAASPWPVSQSSWRDAGNSALERIQVNIARRHSRRDHIAGEHAGRSGGDNLCVPETCLAEDAAITQN